MAGAAPDPRIVRRPGTRSSRPKGIRARRRPCRDGGAAAGPPGPRIRLQRPARCTVVASSRFLPRRGTRPHTTHIHQCVEERQRCSDLRHNKRSRGPPGPPTRSRRAEFLSPRADHDPGRLTGLGGRLQLRPGVSLSPGRGGACRRPRGPQEQRGRPDPGRSAAPMPVPARRGRVTNLQGGCEPDAAARSRWLCSAWLQRPDEGCNVVWVRGTMGS